MLLNLLVTRLCYTVPGVKKLSLVKRYSENTHGKLMIVKLGTK